VCVYVEASMKERACWNEKTGCEKSLFDVYTREGSLMGAMSDGGERALKYDKFSRGLCACFSDDTETLMEVLELFTGCCDDKYHFHTLTCLLNSRG
jgi:hypothetical protein